MYYETVAGGQGGRPGRPGRPAPGMSGVHTGMTNTKNTPIEALERAFPMRVLRYRLRQGSGGAGSAPGGDGIERDLQVLEDVHGVADHRAPGVAAVGAGGRRARARWGRTGCCPAATRRGPSALPDKCTIRLRAGDVLRMLTPGGGGWGTPGPVLKRGSTGPSGGGEAGEAPGPDAHRHPAGAAQHLPLAARRREGERAGADGGVGPALLVGEVARPQVD